MLCKVCGAQIPDDAQECEFCGTKVNEDASAAEETKVINTVAVMKKEKNKDVIVLCLSVQFVLLQLLLPE